MERMHGMTGEPIYQAWANMKARCLNPHTECYHRYGGLAMLVLTRRKKEWIDITTPSGETVRIVVVSFGRNAVKLGFEASRDTLILRSELDKWEEGEDTKDKK